MANSSSNPTSICVFLGSSPGKGDAYLNLASSVGAHLAQQGIHTIYGGGDVGCMGALANGALKAGGKVTGVIPKLLHEKEIAATGLTQLHVVDSMHERKAMMAELCDAFLILPGSIGTLEEFFEAWTWSQLHYHAKPCAILNFQNYYNLLLGFLDHVSDEGFIKKTNFDMLIVSESIEEILTKIGTYEHPTEQKW